MPVPESFSKIDFVCHKPLTYFQVSEETPALIISSPCETTLHQLKRMLQFVVDEPLDTELTKVFSPESTLMEMYVAMLQVMPLNSVLKDRITADNVRQALDETQEGRFVHAIRAIGIAAEELLVQMYETYLREKAPEAPLGNLINEFNGRLQEVVHGVKAVKESPFNIVKKAIGKAIETEKSASRNTGILILAEQIQKHILPLTDDR